ncbi:unnamed protein product, partial [Symbiodinium necroappetens]
PSCCWTRCEPATQCLPSSPTALPSGLARSLDGGRLPAASRILLRNSEFGHVLWVFHCSRASSGVRNLIRVAFLWGFILLPGFLRSLIGQCRASVRNQNSGLLGEAREDNLDMNVVIYNSAISVCEKGEEWQRALMLLEEASYLK